MTTDLLSTITVASVVFAVTDLDDLLLLMALFADPALDRRAIVLGQCLGIALLVLASVLLAVFAVRVSGGYAAVLGLVPLVFGLWRLRHGWRSKQASGVTENPASGVSPMTGRLDSQVLTVTALTVANGGDNLIAYVPLLAAAPARIPVYAMVFAALTVAWCVIAYFGVHNRLVAGAVHRHGHAALPFVMVSLGLWTLSEPLRYMQ